MEFRLTYEGPLRATTADNRRIKHKHAIRRHLHPQLKTLWDVHPALKQRKTAGPDLDELETWIDARARRFAVGDYNFVPLVTEDMRVTCAVDVLYLRPPGRPALLDAGDMDKRLTTLFEALAMPDDEEHLRVNGKPTRQEQPFFCLLETQSLVRQIAVDTDVLLAPVAGDAAKHAARLVIGVTLSPYMTTWDNIGF